MFIPINFKMNEKFMCVVRKVAVDTTSLFGMHSSNGQ